VGCSIGQIAIEKIVKSLMPFYIMLFAYLLVVTYVPAITLFLPGFLK